MLRICLQTLRSRRGSLAGAFVAIVLAVSFAYATGQLMAGALEAPGAGRFAAADAVVSADPTVRFGVDDSEDVVPAPRLPSGLAARATTVPGVQRAIADITFLVGVWDAGRDVPLAGGADHVRGHDWAAAALTPYARKAGREPKSVAEVVADDRMSTTVGRQLDVTAPGGAQRYQVVGIAHAPAQRDGGQAAMFFTSGVARTLSGTPDNVNAIGIFAQPGASAAELRTELRRSLGPEVEVSDRAHAADPSATIHAPRRG